MRRRLTFVASMVVAGLLVAGPASAQSTSGPSQTVTATGTGQTRVLPKNRNSNASIAAAVDAARKASIAGAIRDAQQYGQDYAASAGLTLGGVISISDVQSNGFYGPGPQLGPFGPNQYCGSVELLVGKPVKGKKPKFKKVHRCVVPPFAYTTLTVIYSASTATSGQPQSVTATGTGQTRVLPKNRNSNASIAAAVDAARKASISGAISDAQEYGQDYAASAGLTLGGVSSISDVQSNGFYGPGPQGIGPFGPNQYCGTIERLIGKPKKGKKPKFKKVHRCIVPQFAYTTLTVTYAATTAT
jgi:uncharacterized protein YggE